MSNTNFHQKVFIVTGGTQGLGEGIARYLAENGAAGIVICGRNGENGKRVSEELKELGCEGTYVRADLSKEHDCRKVVATCDSMFGNIHGLVNGAGLTDRGYLDDTTVELWDMLFAVNVRAPFILTQEVARVMKREKTGGSIVNIISMVSHGGPPFLTAYCSSKGALTVFTKNVAHALRYDKIRVNGLNIGWTDTPNEHQVQKKMGKPDNWLEQAESSRPFGRLLKPIDIAEMVGFLLSDRAEMMTGSIIDFDQTVVIGPYE
ncbi:MAG: SDR family oxidoreductase [Hormoscilla sp.]